MGITQTMPTVGINKDFITACFKLPKQTQNKVRNFLDKFQADPRSSGINLERVKDAVDDKLYSARIDQKYRAIIAYQQSSGVYLLLHIDNHDDAYQWAVTKHVGVNDRTNAIQVYDNVPPVEEQAAAEMSAQWSHDLGRQMAVSAGSETTGSPDSSHMSELANQQESHETITSTGPADAEPDAIQLPQQPEATNHVRIGALPEEYAQLTDEDMRRFGVPDIYIPIMQLQTTWEDFGRWIDRLPDDARTCLQLVAEGQPKADVLALADDGRQRSEMLGLEKTLPAESLSRPETVRADDDDFRNALASYGTQQSFVVVQGEDDLKRIFDSPLEQWRVFLHPSQRSYVERSYNGSFRLLGGAGTGKTVVAMHRAKYLAAKLIREHSNKKVLFTTYSSTLATDIQANLKLICTSDELRHIDVMNLDKFIYRFFHDNGYGYEIWYDKGGNGESLDGIWYKAIHTYEDKMSGLALSAAFFKDEWSQVIVPQDISSLSEYLRTPRRGRGTRLSRAQKSQVWQVIEAYQQLMKSERACDIDMAMSMVGTLLARDDTPKRYAHVIVDEGQDFSTPAYKVLRTLVPEHADDLFIVGDAQQRIYGKTVVLSQCGIKIQGRARRLKINYRTTEEIRAAADRIFDTDSSDVADSVFDAVSGAVLNNARPILFDDLEGNEEPAKDSRSLVNGPKPTVRRFVSKQEEIEFVEQWIATHCGETHSEPSDVSTSVQNNEQDDTNGTRVDPRDICIVARTNRLVDQWHESLDNDLPYRSYVLMNNHEDERHQPGIRISTMHRVKGLEFDYVIVTDVDDDICPPKSAIQSASDAVALRELSKQERSLIYVALTRARKEAVLVGCGQPM
ncbi:MAG: AAA family ATPase [Bifidobacterium tibiigranuli]|jgi:superfamily I DNA/RNA helicase/mRNA-degrading endonuclease RelE of RelBE toxin-antitoxin system|nr:AAA family ATPase [Bifidobacterium tibiigranuli]